MGICPIRKVMENGCGVSNKGEYRPSFTSDLLHLVCMYINERDLRLNGKT